MDKQLQEITKKLIENRDNDEDLWWWIEPDKPLSRKNANKFFLGSILMYQIKTEKVLENARRLAEDILGDPDYLWEKITEITLEEWMLKYKEYRLHKFPKAHERVWKIGKRIVQQYEGDVRKIWDGQTIEAVLYRLNDLRAGEQISNMIVGALKDNKIITGKSDVKVGVHIRRVLGRLINGQRYSQQETGTIIDLTRKMYPDDPWMLDCPLHSLGIKNCKAEKPECASCYLNEYCNYYCAKQRADLS